MNEYFNFKRWSLLVRKYYVETRKTYGFLFLATGAGFLLWFGIHFLFANARLFAEEFQMSYFFFGLIISGCLSASQLFSPLASKPKAVAYLLLPGSLLEKLLCILLFGSVFFLIGFTITFYLADVLSVNLANSMFHTSIKVFNVFQINDREELLRPLPNSFFFYFYFALQALFILGSVYFSKNALFKTIVGVLLIWSLTLVISKIVSLFTPPGMFLTNIMFETFEASGDNKIIMMPAWFMFIVEFFLKYLVTTALLLAAYFRVAEKQTA